MKSLEIMQNFNLENIPTLDVAVLEALEMLSERKLPQIQTSYKSPLVVGSGNALATGKILFKDSFAIFSSESDFEEKLKNLKKIDGVIVISASGEKDSVRIIKISKKYNKKITLVTNSTHSSAKKLLDLKKDKLLIFPKQREPYTYNTSTYLSMVFGKTLEKPQNILGFIDKEISKIDFSKLNKYDKFYFVIPDKFDLISRMLHFKFMELFGRTLARDIETESGMKHGTTLVPSKELFVYFGVSPKSKENSIYIPLPSFADYGTIMAIGYFVVGRLQKLKGNLFSKNLTNYSRKMSKEFNQEIKEIVE